MKEWFKDVNQSWTLFLDRDGVINQRLEGDYVKSIDEFQFLESVPKAIANFNAIFGKVVIVTNQQGIGKGLMTEKDLEKVHEYMRNQIELAGGKIDQVYHCPELAQNNPECRKPNPGMAHAARKDFPQIDFERSVMVGDSESDMEFGDRLGMKTVFIGKRFEELQYPTLKQFADEICVLHK